MATSVVAEQEPVVKAPGVEPQPQAERQAEPRVEAEAGEPMDVDTRPEQPKATDARLEEPTAVDTRPEEPKATYMADKTPVATVSSPSTDVVMTEADGSDLKRVSSPTVKATIDPSGVRPVEKPLDGVAPPPPQDEEMLPATPKVEEPATSTPTPPLKTESAEETRHRVRERSTRRLQIQLEFVETARRKVLDETHPDMAAHLANLARERQRMEEVARLRAEQFEHGTSVIFAYECDEANSEFEMQCEKLRQEMLEEIHNEMEIISDQRKGTAASARKTSRNTRSTRGKGGEHVPFAFDTAQKIKKRAGYVFQPLENKLAQSEVDHDVRELTATFEATKKRRVDADAASLPLAKYYRSRLLYRDWIFQEGDEVYVMNYTASSEYAAVICGLTPTEVVVLSEKGKYCRLVMMDLRHGRVVLSTLDDGPARDDESFASS